MKTTSTRQVPLFGVLTVVALALGNWGVEAKDRQDKGEFFKKVERDISVLSSASPADLGKALESSVLQKIRLGDVLGDPKYFFSRLNLDDFYRNTLAGGKTSGGKINLSEEERLECVRALVATKTLLTSNAHVVANCLLVRKAEEMPSLLDGMIAYAVISAEWQIVAQEQRGVWKDLLQSSNPICRLVAVARARTWADEADIQRIVALALADFYCYTRECGLNYISFLPRKEGAAAVKRYIEADRAAAPSEETRRREDRLRDMALRLFNELSKDAK